MDGELKYNGRGGSTEYGNERFRGRSRSQNSAQQDAQLRKRMETWRTDEDISHRNPREVHGKAFRVPNLSLNEKNYLLKKAKESSHALVDHAHTLDGPVQWVFKGVHKGIQMYRGEGPKEGTFGNSTEFLCGVTTMKGTIEEVSKYFDQSTTAKMFEKRPDDVVDCAVLYSLVDGLPDNPFFRVSVKYASYEGPAAFTRNRDYSYLECQDTFQHASGRRGWVLSMHSIKLPFCPDFAGYVRGSMYHSGFVFVEADRPGYMDVMHGLQVNFKGNSRLPHFILNAALKKRIYSIIQISREIQFARMGYQQILQKDDLVPKHLRSRCLNCRRKFHIFNRKTRCRVCGEVVCQPCAPEVEREAVGGGVQKTRICLLCYQLTKEMDDAERRTQLRAKSALPLMKSEEKQYDFDGLNRNNAATHNEGDMNSSIWSEQSEDKLQTSVLDSHNLGGGQEVERFDDNGDVPFEELEVQSSCSVFAPSRFTRSPSNSTFSSATHDVINLEDIGGFDETTSDIFSETSEDVSLVTSSMYGSLHNNDFKLGKGEAIPEESEEALRTSKRFAMAGLKEPDLDESRNMTELNPMNLHAHNQRHQEKLPELQSSASGLANSQVVPTAIQQQHQSLIDEIDVKANAVSKVRARSGDKISEDRISEGYENQSYNKNNLIPQITAVNHDSEKTAKPLDPVNGRSQSKEFSPYASQSSNRGSTRPSTKTTSSLILNQVRKRREQTMKMKQEAENISRLQENLLSIREEHNKRLADINRIALDYVGDGITALVPALSMAGSKHSPIIHGSSTEGGDKLALNSLILQQPDKKLQSTAELSEARAVAWRTSEAMAQYHHKHEEKMDLLRKKAELLENSSNDPLGQSMLSEISTFGQSEVSVSFGLSRNKSADVDSQNPKQDDIQKDIVALQEEYRESIVSVFSDLVESPISSTGADFSHSFGASDFSVEMPETVLEESNDIGAYREETVPKYSSKKIEDTLINGRKQEISEPTTSSNLYEHIRELTKLQGQMTLATNTDEVKKLKEKIRLQYQILRQMKL